MTTRRTILFAPLALRAAERTRLIDTGYPKPFLYPIVAPDGTILSRGWPLEPRPGDSQDHTWHRGIWWGHGDINGFDFWREQQATATIRVDKRTQLNDHIHVLDQSLVPPTGDPIGRLQSIFEIGATQIDATLVIKSTQSLRFGDTDDGGFAVRLREEFREDRGATLLNSEGQKGAKLIWGKPAAWTDYSATINNKTYGVAILSHPTNLRHPAGWHARNYGLNSANPFAASSFANEKNGQRGAYTLPANQALTLRYRVILHYGDNIANHYTQFSKEPNKWNAAPFSLAR